MNGVLRVRNFHGVVLGVDFLTKVLEGLSPMAYLATSPSWQKASGWVL